MNSKTDSTAINSKFKIYSNKSYFDSIAIILFIGLLFTDFIPDFDVVGYTIPVHYLYLSILNLVMGVFIYFNPVLLSTGFFNKIKKSFFIKIYFLFLALCGVSLFFAPNLSLSIVNICYLLISFLTIIHLGILLNNRLYLIYKLVFVVVLCTFFETSIALINFLELLKINANEAYKISLNTGNINIFAVSLNLKIPFVLLGIFTFSGYKKWISIVAFSSSCLILFLNNNKAAFLSLGLIVLLFLVYKAVNNKAYKKIGLVVILLVVAMGFSYLITSIDKETSVPTSVVNNSSDNTEFSMLNSIDKEESASSRIKFWRNAIELSKQNLFTGVGLGNYQVEISPYDNKLLNNGSVTIHPHNDFIEILVETGIVNGLIYFTLFITLLVINVKRIKTKDTEIQTIALLTLLMLLVYGIDSLFNFPLYQPTVQIGFCIIMIFTLLNQSVEVEESDVLVSKKYFIPSILLSLTLLYFTFEIFKTYKLELEIKKDYALEKHLISADYIEKNLPKYPNINNETYPFLQKLGVYHYYEGNFEESKKVFAESKKINPYSGVEDWYLSKIHAKTNIDSAQYYIKKSFQSRPRDLNSYLDLLHISNIKKDTLEIIHTNTVFSSYRDEPMNYIHTSNALYNSGYDVKKLNQFIAEGLTKFPQDSLLIERKEMFQKILDVKNGVVTSSKAKVQSVKNDENTAAEKRLNNVVNMNIYLQEAANYGAKGQYDLALKNYLLVLEKYPDNLAIHQNIGLCKFEQKKFKEAIPYLEKSLGDSKLNDGKSEYFLGICYLNTQNKAKGCSFLNTAKNKNYPNAAQIIEQYCK